MKNYGIWKLGWWMWWEGTKDQNKELKDAKIFCRVESFRFHRPNTSNINWSNYKATLCLLGILCNLASPPDIFSHLYEDSETHTKHDNFSFVLEVLIKGDISNISTMLDLKVYKREFECALFRSFHPLRLHLSIYPSLLFPLLFLSILCILSVVSNIHNF